MPDSPATQRTRGRFLGQVADHRQICREHYRLCLRLPDDPPFAPTRPGQFIQLACAPTEVPDERRERTWTDGGTPELDQPETTRPTAFLRRPFSLAGRRDDGASAELVVIYRVVGVGTGWLQSLGPGDPVDLIGPLGNAFTMPADRSFALLVGGGVGLPPMFYLAESVAAAGGRACAFVGATTADLIPVQWTDIPPTTDGTPAAAVAPFADLGIPTVVTTDDGSLGMTGRITDGLARYLSRQPAEQRRRTIVYTCGPHAMMRAVADLAARYALPCQACMEQSMACGMGTCQSCVLRIAQTNAPHGVDADGRPWRYRLACTDGPVFDAADVIW